MSFSDSKAKSFDDISTKRQSFNERIFDDLCEEILQYLPLKDKLRLESVSKQFQRTVFQKQITISILKDNSYNQKLNLNAFECLLKKCPNIKRISSYDLGNRFLNNRDTIFIPSISSTRPQNGGHLIDLIVKYCRTLRQISSNLYFDNNSWNKLIERIDTKGLTLSLDNRTEYLDKYMFETLDSVKVVNIDNKIKYPFHSSNSLNFMFDCISRLNHLNCLRIRSMVDINYNFSDEELTQISYNCLNLRKMWITLKITSNQSLISSMASLQVLKSLEELTISFSVFGPKPLFSFRLFKGFKRLTHLTLNYTFKISETELTDIELYLPKLKYLKIGTLMDGNQLVIDNLSRLKNLEIIDIVVDNDSIRKNMEQKLRENCPQIRWILIKTRLD